MKKALAVLLIAAMTFAAFSCAPKEKTPAHQPDPAQTETLSFTGRDVNGGEVSMKALSDKKVVMINFWETWCGPCMGELADINRLYETYKDRGFEVIGVYSSSGDDKVVQTASTVGVTYTLMPMVAELMPFTTRYVPTTVFFDGSGKLLLSEPCVGARSYEEWESILLPLLGE